jgi:hypothetical protein
VHLAQQPHLSCDFGVKRTGDGTCVRQGDQRTYHSQRTEVHPLSMKSPPCTLPSSFSSQLRLRCMHTGDGTCVRQGERADSLLTQRTEVHPWVADNGGGVRMEPRRLGCIRIHHTIICRV